MKEDTDSDVDKGKNHDSKAKALMMTRIIVAANDKIDTPIPLLMAELTPLKAMKGVRGFGHKKIGNGTFQILMYGSTLDGGTTTFDGKNENKKLDSKEVRNLISTEEDAQFQVESMKKTLQSGNIEDQADLWKQPIKITSHDGKDYILDGHNRLKALAELNMDLPSEATLLRLTKEEANLLFKDKMEYILKGEFNLKISD